MNKELNSISSDLNSIAYDKRGAGFTEYLILVGLIALIGMGAFELFGAEVVTTVTNHTGAVTNLATAP